ncbi:MAG: hypothetical protein K2X34_03215 [Hyphomonadaceae bacterium]|nr:hypothetical protein [Hyphomonadaceae bacterium]
MRVLIACALLLSACDAPPPPPVPQPARLAGERAAGIKTMTVFARDYADWPFADEHVELICYQGAVGARRPGGLILALNAQAETLAQTPPTNRAWSSGASLPSAARHRFAEIGAPTC